MNFAGTLCWVLAGVYGLANLLLSILIACAWRSGLERRRSTSGELLALRLLPCAGASLLTLTVVLPAFCLYEPRHDAEQTGPLLVMAALFALGAAGHGALRAWRAVSATRGLLRRCGPADRSSMMAGRGVDIVDVPEPLVAVVGAWRPRILAAGCIRAACSEEEFRQVMAHEAAHVSAHDNAKLLLLLLCPDALAWMTAGTGLTERWRAAAELEADARASGSDPRRRVALASALIKVARLSSGAPRQSTLLGMPVAFDDVQGRVRQLLSPPARPHKRLPVRLLMACSLMIVALGVPMYPIVQGLVESLVALGR